MQETLAVLMPSADAFAALARSSPGLRPGAGHVLTIEAVDEPMDDALIRRRRSIFRRQ